MNERNTSIRKTMDAIVPISRFNRGEANKIFDEVNARGVKVVLKNNAAVCVLVNPERYDEMVAALEDYALFFEAEQRVKASGAETLSHAEIKREFGIQDQDLEDAEVEIE
ncbi:type II toxin-antitoxin system Phd/YefM family antitoxin [Dehalobacterium formicoaceticum]|uniref:Type II toxin-antitoxin system Phd/YefM family antitoxin n=1 Tax=Dehalobacterium formicoaceticum TaxID=51515 RepID=A0ABT1Y268_9FIRM|nr:type II toxin-antitoxin system Phd/YefM family antitoxin [Dehalobacterium formicoaceticum]MCR6544972.1 type II toxin-antitoxin system Phd/YefM family antitoxin [Dehalobacterium formicoaceticum]